jgi:hypothetical protein
LRPDHQETPKPPSGGFFIWGGVINSSMLNFFIFLVFGCLPLTSYALEIFALGTSNTNCRAGGNAFTTNLQALLLENGINAQVINAGNDGDKPVFMMNRLEQGLNSFPNTKIVIFEPGPNERNVSFATPYIDKILAFLQDKKITTIYISSDFIQPREEAKATAEKYGAFYDGPWQKGVPVNRENFTFDGVKWAGGHMAEGGCKLRAKNLLPTVLRAIKENNIQ